MQGNVEDMVIAATWQAESTYQYSICRCLSYHGKNHFNAQTMFIIILTKRANHVLLYDKTKGGSKKIMSYVNRKLVSTPHKIWRY